MLKILLTTFFIFILSCSYSQRIKGIVINESDSPLGKVTIVNQNRNTGTTSGNQGEFILNANTDDIISFSYIGKKTVNYKIKKSDTNIVLITLKEDISKLKEFNVSNSRIEKVSAEKNENILDFCSLGENTLLVLKRKNYTYLLTIEGIDTVYKVYPLNEYKPKELYVDFNKNIHLICKDSIRQIYFDSLLQIVSTISENEFYYFLKPTIHKYDSSLLVFVHSSHNKRYTLFEESASNKKIIYQSFDSVRSAYISHWVWIRSGRPKIEKVGNLNSASLQMARDIFVDKGFYAKILCRKLFVNSFVVNNTSLVFDLFSDSLFGFNQQGNLLKSVSLKEIKDLNPKEILQNKEMPTLFYAVTENVGIYSYHTIDLLSGKTSNTFTLSEFNFPKKVQIINNWIYFIQPNKANYNKLYRVNMNER